MTIRRPLRARKEGVIARNVRALMQGAGEVALDHSFHGVVLTTRAADCTCLTECQCGRTPIVRNKRV